MKRCTHGVTLSGLIAMDSDLLVLVGAEGESGDPDDQDDDQKEGKDGNQQSKSENEKAQKKDEPGDPIALKRELDNLKAERERNVNKRVAAQDEAAELKIQIADLKKNGTTDETSKASIIELTETVSKQNSLIKTLSLQVAFLKDNTHEWVDPDAAMRLANLEGVEIEDDGSVHGLSAALDELAAGKTYLLKPKEQVKKPEPRKTGDPADKGGNKGDKDEQARRAGLEKRFPGLRRR